jgi:hypothetical protein
MSHLYDEAQNRPLNGNISHYLTIKIVSSPSKEIEQQIMEEINNIIEGERITKTILEGVDVTIVWNTVPFEPGLYLTDVKGMWGDVAVSKHRDLLMKEVLEILNRKFNQIFSTGNSILLMRITKPLSRNICLHNCAL